LVNLLLSAFSGLLLSAAFEPISLWWVAPIALALEMFALSRSGRKYLSVLAFALTFNLVLLHWTSTYVGSVPWTLLAAGLSLFYLPLVAVKRLGIAFFPLIFIVLEEIRNRFPRRFATDFLSKVSVGPESLTHRPMLPMPRLLHTGERLPFPRLRCSSGLCSSIFFKNNFEFS